MGQTSRTAEIRISEHLSDIRLKRNLPVSSHFLSHDSSVHSFQFQVIEQIVNEDKRKLKEIKWIKRLNCGEPKVLNLVSQIKHKVFWTLPHGELSNRLKPNIRAHGFSHMFFGYKHGSNLKSILST